MSKRKAVAYTRVSRVGDRAGASYISPDVQREAIEAMAERDGIEIVELIHEENVSGGDSTRAGWQRALAMVESGSVKAVAVYNFSRFSRNQVDAIEAIDRIRAGGGQLLSVQEGSFDNTAAGTLLRDTLFRFAQFERDRAAESFLVAQERFIKSGGFLTSRIPTGYIATVNAQGKRSVEPDPVMAPIIHELFEKRATGASWTRLAEWFIEQGGSPKTSRRAIERRLSRTLAPWRFQQQDGSSPACQSEALR